MVERNALTCAQPLQRSRRPKTAESPLGMKLSNYSLVSLQRSRRPKTAESRTSRPRSSPPSRLQRSRRPKTAERSRRRPVSCASAPASTEPPSEDGGEGRLRSTRATPTRGFNGAAVRRRRRDWAAVRVSTRIICFNGAAVRRRRREGSTAPARPASPMLQRSRRPKTAESCVGSDAMAAVPDSFNGAAVRRRRRGEHVLLARVGDAALQRSRRPKTAESVCLQGATFWVCCPLQRSRRPKTAESSAMMVPAWRI